MKELPSLDEPFYSIVLVGMRRPPIWSWPTFSAVEPALRRLTELPGTPVAVRSVQGEGPAWKQPRFGRLSWSPESHRRWVHDAPGAAAISGARTFCLTEIWVPGWGRCDREKGAPFLFVSIANPFLLGAPRADQFNQLVHVALPVALARHHAAAVEGALADVAAGIDAVQSVYRVTPWLHGWYSVQDGLTNHYDYIGRHLDAVPDLTRMKARWLPFTGTLGANAS